MSVNSYKTGCHLLNHDDVIGSRRVSYILYMPLPQDKEWDEAWGGALELYPVENGELQPLPSKKVLPSWNQFIFFEVQPGRSFHSVEEVVVGGGKDTRDRLSISGWFHKAQEGEEGYQPDPSEHEPSSLEQLVRLFLCLSKRCMTFSYSLRGKRDNSFHTLKKDSSPFNLFSRKKISSFYRIISVP